MSVLAIIDNTSKRDNPLHFYCVILSILSILSVLFFAREMLTERETFVAEEKANSRETFVILQENYLQREMFIQ